MPPKPQPEYGPVLAFMAGDSFLEVHMLYTLAVVLLILWLLGLVSGYTIGAFIHVLLVIAVVLVLAQLISGRRSAL